MIVRCAPNIDHMAEHSTTLRQRPPIDYAAAIVMLRQALGRSVTIEWPADQQAGGKAVIHLADTTPIKIHLVPWGTRLQQGTRRIVWVIPRASKALRKALRQRDEQFVDLSGAV